MQVLLVDDNALMLERIAKPVGGSCVHVAGIASDGQQRQFGA